MADFEDVLDYWFGDAADDAGVIAAKSALWWGKDPERDRECAALFGETVAAAVAGELDAWAERSRSRLALIVVLDQMTRQIHRDSPDAFSGDARARQLAAAGITRRHDVDLRYVERVFFYLPFEHSEDLEDHKRSVELFRGLLAAAPSALEDRFSEYLDYAIAHRDVIARFGRFPHRNAILGRDSTPEELAYLAEPGAGF